MNWAYATAAYTWRWHSLKMNREIIEILENLKEKPSTEKVDHILTSPIPGAQNMSFQNLTSVPVSPGTNTLAGSS